MMKKVLVAIPFKADNVSFEANKEYELEEAVIERALKVNPNMLTVIGSGDEFAEIKASLEAETKARAKAEEDLANATEELTKVSKELEKVKKQLAKATKDK